ncbi:MAG: hypothetical protein QNJ12_01470 [Ilumatobacter sp.]|uniref:hypothetical protein n=1 Tax=Ilumatobacter sp. TaxID=1967498 RepID=UPI002614383B|nr:hypothetical protein [Ilumatobacter sp.]MDJ0767423.1 hypothetical protein [Ilumatobacter sp.]
MHNSVALLADGAATGPPAAGATGTVPLDATLPVTMWVPWEAREWPATTAEETAFVDELSALAGGRSAEPRRSDITAVLNALRSGTTVSQLLDVAPGLRADRLCGAHATVEARRRRSENAFRSILCGRTIEDLERHGDAAALLVPVLVERLLRTADNDPRNYRRVLGTITRQVVDAHHDVAHVETQLSRLQPPSEWGIALGRQLTQRLMSRAEFLPRRVGVLTPIRVAALLGERLELSGARGTG